MKIGWDVSFRLASIFMVEVSLRTHKTVTRLAFTPCAWTLYASWNQYPGSAFIHVGPFSASICVATTE